MFSAASDRILLFSLHVLWLLLRRLSYRYYEKSQLSLPRGIAMGSDVSVTFYSTHIFPILINAPWRVDGESLKLSGLLLTDLDFTKVRVLSIIPLCQTTKSQRSRDRSSIRFDIRLCSGDQLIAGSRLWKFGVERTITPGLRLNQSSSIFSVWKMAKFNQVRRPDYSRTMKYPKSDWSEKSHFQSSIRLTDSLLW